MRKKTQKQIIHDYLRANPSSSAKEVSDGTGIKQASASAAIAHLLTESLVQKASETAALYGITRYYEIVPGTEMERNHQDITYDVLLDRGQSTASEIAKAAGLSVRAASNALTALKRSGRIEMTGIVQVKRSTAYTYRAISQERKDDLTGVIKKAVELGGGPFGLMAAQLGAIT